jgi:hypothetical protein
MSNCANGLLIKVRKIQRQKMIPTTIFGTAKVIPFGAALAPAIGKPAGHLAYKTKKWWTQKEGEQTNEGQYQIDSSSSPMGQKKVQFGETETDDVIAIKLMGEEGDVDGTYYIKENEMEIRKLKQRIKEQDEAYLTLQKKELTLEMMKKDLQEFEDKCKNLEENCAVRNCLVFKGNDLRSLSGNRAHRWIGKPPTEQEDCEGDSKGFEIKLCKPCPLAREDIAQSKVIKCIEKTSLYDRQRTDDLRWFKLGMFPDLAKKLEKLKNGALEAGALGAVDGSTWQTASWSVYQARSRNDAVYTLVLSPPVPLEI